MLKARFSLFIAIVVFLVACAPRTVSYKPSLENEGEVFIYLQPVSQGGERLRFVLEGISAIGKNGSEHPLALSISEIKGKEIYGEQKLLASGVLPPGAYRGLSIKIRNAFLMGEEGEGVLVVPEAPATIAEQFSVIRRRAAALFLVLDPSPSVTSGFSFIPAFTLQTLLREPVNLSGYVTDSEENIIHVFNKKTNRIFGAIATGRRPKGIVLDQSRKRAYVAVSGADAVEMVDLFAQAVTGRVNLNPGDEPSKLALTPDNRTLLSANYGSGTVSIIDTDSQYEVRRIKVGEGPTDVAIDPRGMRAFVVNSLSDTISIIDIPSRRLSGTIPVGPTPLKESFSRAGDRLYVATRHSPDLFVIDPKIFTVTGRIFVGIGAVSIKVERLTDLIYVGNEITEEISIVEPRSFMPVDSIAVEGTPYFMTIDGEERALFVTVPERKKILKVNMVNKRIESSLPVNGRAHEAAVMGEN